MIGSDFVATAYCSRRWVIRSEGSNLLLSGELTIPKIEEPERKEAAEIASDSMLAIQQIFLSMIEAAIDVCPAARSGFQLYAFPHRSIHETWPSLMEKIFEFKFVKGSPAVVLETKKIGSLKIVLPANIILHFCDLGLDYTLSNAGFLGVQTLKTISNSSSNAETRTLEYKDQIELMHAALTIMNTFDGMQARLYCTGESLKLDAVTLEFHYHTKETLRKLMILEGQPQRKPKMRSDTANLSGVQNHAQTHSLTRMSPPPRIPVRGPPQVAATWRTASEWLRDRSRN
jgi:hypothetical protein